MRQKYYFASNRKKCEKPAYKNWKINVDFRKIFVLRATEYRQKFVDTIFAAIQVHRIRT